MKSDHFFSRPWRAKPTPSTGVFRTRGGPPNTAASRSSSDAYRGPRFRSSPLFVVLSYPVQCHSLAYLDEITISCFSLVSQSVATLFVFYFITGWIRTDTGCTDIFGSMNSRLVVLISSHSLWPHYLYHIPITGWRIRTDTGCIDVFGHMCKRKTGFMWRKYLPPGLEVAAEKAEKRGDEGDDHHP